MPQQKKQFNMKSTWSVLLGLLLLAPPAALAQFNYTTINGTITITGYIGSGGPVAIPGTINGLPVTAITSYAFAGLTNLTSITIGTNVASIGQGAFADCTSVTNITIPSSVTNISGSFSDCYSLASIMVDAHNANYSSLNGVLFDKSQMTLIQYPIGAPVNSYTIPGTVTGIYALAFADCTTLITVTIPASVSNIGIRAFFFCTSLTSVPIPNSVISIDEGAFDGCVGLTNVTIPGSVTSIGDDAFFFCYSLTNVTIPNSVTNIGSSAFSQTALTSVAIPGSVATFGDAPFFVCRVLTNITVDPQNANYSSVNGVLFNKSQTVLIQFPCGLVGSFVMPGSVTGIGTEAFEGSLLTSVTMPSSLTTIGDYAFEGCNSLTSVTIGAALSSIGEDAFEYCSVLTGIYFHGNAAAADSTAFQYDSTATVYYYAGTSGWGSTYEGLPALMLDAPVPYGSLQVTILPGDVIANGAQWQVDGGIPQPSGATVLGLSVGSHTVSFSTVGGWTTPPNQSIPVGADSTVAGSAIYTQLIQSQFTYATNNGTITITGYTGSGGAVAIPSTITGLPVTSIGVNAFASCRSLTSVTIPSTVTNIGATAFNFCISLTSVAIPSSVTSIGEYAFLECLSLTSVTIPSSVTNIGVGPFSDCMSLTAITVDTNNPAYVSIAGVLFNESQTTLIQYPAGKVGTSYTIPTTVTTIAGNAFDNCFSLTTVTIPASVTDIGGGAFYACESLSNVTIPGSVTSIGDSAFAICSGLSSVTIPGSVTNIGVGPFAECASLTTIAVSSNNPTYISIAGVLFNESQNTLVQYPAGEVGTSYTIPSSVTSIGEYAFLGSSGITSVVIGNAATSIGLWAFAYCSGLTNATVGSSVTSIGTDAFFYCGSLLSVYFAGNAPNAYSTAFDGDTNATAYYVPGTSGWGSTFAGLPTVLLNAPIPAGSLQVTIAPSGAITAGAQWQVDAGVSQPSGATVLGLSVGNHAVSFTTINGWSTPSNQLVSVNANSTTMAVGTYTRQAALQVAIQPTNNPVLITAGSNVTFSTLVTGVGPFSYQWQINGTNLPNGIISTVAGNGIYGYSGDGGMATNAELTHPGGVAVDATGNLFIADYYSFRTRRVGTNGLISTAAGNGTQGHSGDGGAATNAELGEANGMAMDGSGNLFIADTSNQRIRKVGTNGIITTVAGNGTQGYSGDGGAATDAELYNPYGVAVDATGNLFIADTSNQRIRRVGANGIVTTVAGNGTLGYFGDGGAATNAELWGPSGVAVDGTGNLFIAELYNDRIRKVGTSGIITTVAGNGTFGYFGDGGSATNSELYYPRSVSVDATGNLFIADSYNNRIREVGTNGIVNTAAGGGGSNPGDGGAATNARLQQPESVAVDATGNLFIADSVNSRIRKVVHPSVVGLGPTLSLNDVAFSNAGAYDVVVSGPYGSVTSSVVTVFVKQATPIIAWTNAAAITYGTALSSTQLNATANVPGTFAYSPTNGAVLNTGSNLLSVVFTPTNTTDYSTVTDAVALVVSRVPLTVTASNAIRAYGQANPLFTGTIVGLTNSDNITASYGCSATTTTPVGTNAIIPALVDLGNRQTNYTVTLVDGTLTITQAVPVLTWTNPPAFIYGAALSTSQLNTTANVPGSFAYNPKYGTVLNAGTNTVCFIFTPAATVDYSSVTDCVSLVVLPAPLTVTAANASRAYGQANPVFTGTIVGVTNNDNITATYSCSATTSTPVGTDAITPALVDPGDRQPNYTVTLVDGTLTITQAVAVLTWTNPAAITYGTALSTNQLNGTANMPGTFAYSPTNGSVLNAGTNLLSVVFTPTDTNGYKRATDSVSLIVLKATPLLTWPAPSPMTYGTALSTNQLNATANVPGSMKYAPAAGSILPPGSNTLSVTFTPTDTIDYTLASSSVTLVVSLGPLPDLQVISVATPSQAWTGRSFDASWLHTNSGNGVAIGPWVDRVYLSVTNQLQTNVDQVLGDFVFQGRLEAGQAVQLTQPVVINRAGITNGPYYVSVLADVSNNVFEVSRTNNSATSSSNMYVQVTPLAQLTVASVDAPANAIGGQPVGVGWVVCNQGQADTGVPVWYDHLYLSKTTNLTGVVADYGLYENASYLAVNECYEQEATVILPIGISGPFYFLVDADATGAEGKDGITNTLGSTTLPMNIQLVTAGFLHVASVQVAPAPPTATWPGQEITCTYIVQNIGQASISGIWDDRITLSPVADYVNGTTTGFAYENDIGVAGPLAPGASYTNSAQFTLPQSVAGRALAGTWYVVPVVDIHFAAGGAGFGTGNVDRDELAAPLDISAPPPSDLEILSVSAPTNAVEGQPINVGWTVANNGNNQTSSDYWYDSIYLCANTTFDPAQSTVIGTYGHFGVLDLTSNYTQNASVTVPADLFPANILAVTNYLFVFTDAGDDVAELDKTNNVLRAADPLVIQQAPPILPADLAVTAVVAPWTIVAGGPATISWSVTNQGAGATSVGSWVDSVYLAPGPTLNLALDQWLGDVPHSGTLASGGSYSQSQAFSLPYCAIGSYYVLVVVDSAHQVNEGGAVGNNVRASNPPMRIWPGNAARLQVSAVSATDSVLAGAALTVSWSVTNLANATTNAPWVDALYLSSTPQFVPTNAYLLGLYTNTENLASGGTYTDTQSPVVPRCFSGPYYVSVVTDVGNVVNGISCDANDWATAGAPVQVTPNGYASLQVAGMSLPTVVTSGIPWTAQWTVTNAGPSAASGTWSDAIYASLSPVLDVNALLLGLFGYTNSLASGASYAQSQPVALPQCLSGPYYIYVVADVSNRVNWTACQVNDKARSASPLTVNIGPYPDLQVTSVGIPATAYAGQPMPVSWTVTNAGSATASGPWLDSVYLSPISAFSSGNSVLLGSYPYSRSLAAGAGYSQTTAFTLPNTTHGNFYAFIVTDSTNAVNECQAKTNNVAGSPSLVNVPVTLYPDLRVTSVQVPGAALAGQPITVTWVVANDGTLSTGRIAWNDAVYLSLDEVLDPSDVRLGTFPNVSSLGVGQSYTNAATVVIPPGNAGPFYILVLADSGAALFEHLGYNDSLGWNPDAMLVSLPPYVDLAANNVSLAPSSGAPGTQTTIAWTVSNVSTNNTASTWTDAIYLSTNNFWDITAALVADVNHTGLAANSSYNASWTGPLPALSPGAYYAILRADVRNTVPELNLSNNVVVSPNTITTDVPILPLGQPVTNQLSTGSAQYYKIDVAPGQTLQIDLTGASTSGDTQLFVRYAAMPDLGNFDFLYSNPLSPNQQIVIPTTQKGWYYIMVRGENEPGGPLGYTLEAHIVPFAITGVSPNAIGDNGQVTITITGAQFQPGATVELISGTNAYFSQTNFFTDATSIGARFLFTNAVDGVYDVVLTNPGGHSATATGAMAIEAALPLSSKIVPGIVNHLPRAGTRFDWSGLVVNTGNLDIPYLTAGVALSSSYPITLTPPPAAVAEDTDSTDNAANACSFMLRDVAPGVAVSFAFSVSAFDASAFSYYICLTNQSKQDFLQYVSNEAQIMADFVTTHTNGEVFMTTNLSGQITTNVITIPPPLAVLMAVSNIWMTSYAQALESKGILDANDLASLPSSTLTVPALRATPSESPKDATCDGVCDYAAQLIDKLKQLDNIKTIAECATLCSPSLVGGLGPYGLCVALCWAANQISGIPIDNLLDLLLQLCNSLCSHPIHASCSDGDLQVYFGGTLAFTISSACPPSPGDPNEMRGPAGYSSAAFVGSQVPWLYTIYFENESNAVAFARQIAITNVLNSNFDIRTFRVGQIVLGGITIPVPANRSFYQARVSAPYPNPTNIVMDVTAGVDVQHSTVFWTMNAIDLNTGQLVENVFEGVLPPDTTNHIGEGYVSYTIQPASSVPTGTVTTNDAAIVFDINDPIITNTTTNTVDAVPPTSTVLALPAAELTTNFTVSWFGTDDPNGSGIASYDIYVSDDGGPWHVWLGGTTQTSATFSGQPGDSYYFYSVATDSAGNVEATPSTYEAMTLVSSNQPPTVQPIADQTIIVGDSLMVTNVASGPNGPETLNFSLGVAPPGAYIDPTNGVLSWSPDCTQGSTTNLITLWTTDSGTPPLSNSVSFLVTVPECIEASLGSTVMQTGQTSSVPVNLLSTTSLTNMAFNVPFPMDRFTNFALTVNSSQVLTQQLQLTTGYLQVSFTLPASQVLHGPTNVGQLSFSAVPSGHSAFVQLGITDVLGLKPDGSLAAKAYGLPGRIVLIGPEPLLQGWTSGPTNAVIEIYGNPGSNYLMTYSTNLPASAWLPGWSIPMTNLWQTFEINSGQPQMYYRAQ